MANETGANKKVKAKKTCEEWIISINNTLAEVKRPLKLSIYKVPNKLVKLKEDAYAPSIVSIGPFHHKNKELLAFEEHKQRYMLHLFMRISEAAPSTLKECATAILDLEGEVRRCYSEYIEFDAQELAEILLVDGCFILELFLRYSDMEKYMDKVEEDPIINNASTIATLQHDLALLENQIPFPVLQKLFDIIKKHMPQPLQYSFTTTNSVVNLALLFFKRALGLTMSNESVESKSQNLTGDHLLDILHNFYVPTTFDRSQHGGQRSESRKCAGAARLLKAGIRLHVDTSSENLLDIKFKKGVVTMPPLQIQESITESIFRNLIAFEQCSISTSHYIASYALLMKRLLSSSHDVEILRIKKIIINDLSDDDIGSGSGGDEVVTTLFKSMCDGVVLNDFCFSWLCEEVNDYPKACLDLRRLKARVTVICREYMLVLGAKYFVTPWTTLSVIAAGLVLGFTAMQTYYSARTYYHQY